MSRSLLTRMPFYRSDPQPVVMSSSDTPREPRAPRKARPRPSLKMQAIGFLSRREHSRQELRAKLLDSLRKRAREDAALEAAAEKAAQELAEALRMQPSNGIDDAFAPPMPAMPPAARAMVSGSERETPRPARRATVSASAEGATSHPAGAPAPASARGATPTRAAVESLSLASGAPLPAALRASLLAADSNEPRSAAGVIAAARSAAADDSTLGAGRASQSFGEAWSAPRDKREASRDASADDDLEHDDPEAAVDQLLDWLAANNYLSEARFVESRVNARSRKQGALRIKLELSRHGLALDPEQAVALRETEFARAQALWQRKFGALAADARERAKQARFLASRGFAADVVRRVVGGEEEF